MDSEDNGGNPPEKYSDVLFAHRVTGERERLGLLAAALDEQTHRRVEARRPRPDGRFLTLGAGLGTVPGWLARRYPDAEVVATDLTTTFLEERDEPNLTVKRHDLTTDDFPYGSFDLIHTRWVLSDLATRDADLRRIVRWLAPGGTLLLEEGASFLEYARPGPVGAVSLACLNAAAHRLGVDGHWARAFPAQLVEAGLRDCGTDGNAPTEFQGGDAWATFWRVTFERLLPDVLAAGDVTAEQAAEAFTALSDPAFRDVGMTTVAAWGHADVAPAGGTPIN